MTAAPHLLDAPPVAHDRFPVTITTHGHPAGLQAVPECRLIVLGGPNPRVLVWRVPGMPVIDQPLDPAASMIGNPVTEWILADGHGRSVVVARGRGCGCANPLKGWQPVSPYTMGVLLA